MKIHQVRYGTAVGKPLVVEAADKTQTFKLRVPAEGVLMRFSLAAENNAGNTTLTVDLLDEEASEAHDVAVSRVIPQQTMTVSNGLMVTGLYAYSNTHKRTISGADLVLRISGSNDIPKGASFAATLIIRVGGAWL